jgi:predicted Zn-ribbon and HTH transcriptional regulator
MMKFTAEIYMETRRCRACGRWWALEDGAGGDCPKCKSAYVDGLREQLKAARRTNAGLKGALARAKGKR